MDACEVAAMKAELMRQFAAFDFTRRGNAMIDAQAAAVQHGLLPAMPAARRPAALRRGAGKHKILSFPLSVAVTH